jgi:hypothetical protein
MLSRTEAFEVLVAFQIYRYIPALSSSNYGLVYLCHTDHSHPQKYTSVSTPISTGIPGWHCPATTYFRMIYPDLLEHYWQIALSGREIQNTPFKVAHFPGQRLYLTKVIAVSPDRPFPILHVGESV